MHGDFTWYELMTSDVEAAHSFYCGLLGWTFEDSDFGDTEYRVFSGSEGQVGGSLQLSAEMLSGGARPAWIGYVEVSELPAALDAWKASGGSVVFGPSEVPGVGPFAMVCDPQGAMLYLIEDRSGLPSPAFARHAPLIGHCAWNELMTADPARANAFYNQQFGWVVGETMDMGATGAYDMLKVGDQGDYMLGGVMQKPAEMPVSAWMHYFRVPEIDAGIAYCKANGAQIIAGPMEVPGGDFAATGIDPQGAVFCIVGTRDA